VNVAEQMSLAKVVSYAVHSFTSVGTTYAKAAQKRPFAVGFVTTGLKTSAADLFAQTVRYAAPAASLTYM
jgi:hypothetical protein